MKTITFLSIIMISIIMTGCTKEESDNELTKGEINANLITDILNKNSIKWIEVYEYNCLTGEWVLAARNLSYAEGMDLCKIVGTYFYLNVTGSKTYNTENASTHNLTGFYYFNLEYLVSFELGTNKDELYLYFKY